MHPRSDAAAALAQPDDALRLFELTGCLLAKSLLLELPATGGVGLSDFVLKRLLCRRYDFGDLRQLDMATADHFQKLLKDPGADAW